MSATVPRPEYPRPQFRRPDWLCLNGTWEFEIDAGDTGLERGLLDRPLAGSIAVPFCPESALSGVHCTDFLNAVWYRRVVRIPEGWAGRTPWLHFQAVDYDATVWANGLEAGRHRGGFTPFSIPLEHIAAGEEVEIVVRARDSHVPPQPRGKQSQKPENHGCSYTRTTGIWQTVWLEPLPARHLRRARITPGFERGVFRIKQPLGGAGGDVFFRATLSDEAGVVADATVPAAGFAASLELAVPTARRRAWSPEDPHLYDLRLELLDGEGRVLDAVESYAGLRSVRIEGQAILLNGSPVFQRLVLDQGYYPAGLMTAPSDEALRGDILLAREAGFNGARLHQKVFEERFLYHADRLGWLCWGEFADWGCAGYGPADDHQKPGASYVTEWLEALERDYSHPSIIGWCPLNETAQTLVDEIRPLDDVTRAMFFATKAMDLTRPVLDASGYSHRVPETDIFDCHDYDQNPESFARRHAGLAGGKPYVNTDGKGAAWSVPYRGQPFFVSEFGGIWWNPQARPDEDSWGYGERPKSTEEFYERFAGLCQALLGNPHMFGYCYTQLTDVFQEQNGIYGFDRSPKFDAGRLRKIQQRSAAIERTTNGPA